MRHYSQFSYQSYDTIVLANGSFPTTAVPLGALKRWEDHPQNMCLACCDGAVNNLRCHTDLLPNVVIGDLDSVDPQLISLLGDRVVHISEQDTNDLNKTMMYVTQHLGKKQIIILGLTGKREDHTLANLAWLPHYAPWVDELIVLTDNGYFRLIQESSSIDVEVGQQISVFTFEPTPITLKGVHWPVTDYTLPYLWSGTLNRADESTITIETSKPLLLYVANK